MSTLSRPHPNLARLATAATALAFAVATPAQIGLPVTIVNPQPGGNDRFGSAVSLSGNQLAVGAVYDDTEGLADAGGVFVYARSGNQWQLVARPRPADLEAGDWFSGVSLQGRWLAVGASRKNNKVGAAYVFERNGDGSWTQQVKLEPESPAPLCGYVPGCHLFGGNVSLDGDTLAISAVTENAGAGAVYVFTRQAGGQWQRVRLTAQESPGERSFGSALRLQGDRLLIGAQSAPINGNTRQGAAYVFERKDGAWTQQARFFAEDGMAQDSFGRSADLDGDSALIGALNTSLGGDARRGAAYVFKRDAATGEWRQQARLDASDGLPDDQFGFDVQLRGDEALVSRFPGIGADPSPGANGTAYLFRRSGIAWTEVKHFTAADGSPGDGFGASLAMDAQSFVVGASSASLPPGPVSQAGKVYLYDRLPLDRIFADGFGQALR